MGGGVKGFLTTWRHYLVPWSERIRCILATPCRRARLARQSALHAFHKCFSINDLRVKTTVLQSKAPQVFLMNALDLRQQILFACGEGDDDTSPQYDSGHIQRLFLRTVETGLQDESIRAKIHPFLKDTNVSDEVLMQQMSMATSAEKERDKKLRDNSKSKPPALSVSAVSDDSSKGREENKKSTRPQNDLLTAISAIKSEVEALKSEVRKNTDKSVPPAKWPERRRPLLCSSCHENKKEYCNHCFKCGSDFHFARGCKKQLNRNRLLPRDGKQW